MMSLILLLYLFLLTIFILTSNPLMASLLLLVMSLSLFVLTGVLASTWFGMSILLIFSGGMMIVFLYMTSLCSNYKFNIKLSSYSLFLILPSLHIPQLKFFSSFLAHPFTIAYLYNPLNYQMFFFMILYIIFALVFVVALSQYFQGSLKKSY